MTIFLVITDFNAFSPAFLAHICGVLYFYRPQRSWGKVIFSEACVKISVYRGEARVAGGRAWQGSVHGRGACMVGACMAGGHAWQGACVAGSVHCRGHAWQGDVCTKRGMCGGGGGMCGRGHTWQGACMTGGPRGIRSMSGRFASYWNAFFFRMSHLTILTLSELPTAELLDLRSYKQ